MTENYDRLNEFVEQHNGNLDSLSLDERDAAQMKLEKAVSMDLRGLEDRADTLREDVAVTIGAEDEDTNTDTLSKEAVAGYLSNYDLDTLNAKWKIEETIETLEQKIGSFENRDMENRADELRNEITALEGAKSEVDESNKKYEDIDTLASRIVREGSVLTAEYTGDGFNLSSRNTGGTTVTLKESGSGDDVDTLSRTMNPQEVNRAVSQITHKVFRGGSD